MTPHYKVNFSCGHVLECACTGRRSKRETTSKDMCPDCYARLINEDVIS